MRALTLIAPMGQAIIADHPLVKRVENRSQILYQSIMDETKGVIAIHSGKKWSDEYAEVVKDILGAGIDLNKARADAGKIIGLMRLSGKVFTHEDPPTDPAMLRWFGGPYGIEIVDAVALTEPIPVRGYQTFWRVPEAEAEIIYRQVPAWRPA